MSDGTLFVKDSRTSRSYEIPIHRNAIAAASFKNIKADSNDTNPTHKVGDGLRLFDPGLENTAILESELTWIDGKRGNILFRGHTIDQVWGCDYEDIVHLMVWGSIPSPEKKAILREKLAVFARDVPSAVADTIHAFPRTAPPMTMVIAGLSAYLGSNPSMIPAFTGGNLYHGNMELVDKSIIQVLAVYSTILGLATSHRAGRQFVPADPQASHLSNQLLMMGNVNPSTGKPDPKKVSCLEHFIALGADHELTNSTFALLVTSSSLADPISCLISALAAGYGPLHFGAPEAAIKTMAAVGKPANVPRLIKNVKAGKGRLFGYGHRTYKTVDPRITLIKGLLEELRGEYNPLLAVAEEIDRVASTDEYFVSRNLKANADLYGVFLFIALGFSPEIIPVMMVFGRLPGMMAHWRESMSREIKLLRPQQIYTGSLEANRANSKL